MPSPFSPSRAPRPPSPQPDNLVFDGKSSDAAIKLIDFGYAGHCTATQPLRGLCGTPDYAAPEILSWYSPAEKGRAASGKPYDHAVDMWSLGVVLYILLCGFPPFYGDEDEEMFELIRRATYAFPEDIDGYQTTWGGISAQAKGLIRQLLCVDPRERLSAAAVGKHEWVSSRVARTPRSWMGKMRERSSSGCTARNSGAIRAQFWRNSPLF